MYVGQSFQPMSPDENEVFGINFVNDLAAGESIVSVTAFNISVKQGTDATPTTHLVGVPSFVGTTVVQRISGVLNGVEYILEAVIFTTAGNTRSLFSYLPGETPS